MTYVLLMVYELVMSSNMLNCVFLSSLLIADGYELPLFSHLKSVR